MLENPYKETGYFFFNVTFEALAAMTMNITVS